MLIPHIFTQQPMIGSAIQKGIKQAAQANTQVKVKDSVQYKSLSHGQANTNYTLFSSDINANDVQQGSLNDCYFLSAVSALVHHRPHEIKRMIKENSNGTYTVKFPGAKYSVTVDKPKDSWRSGTGRTSDNKANNSHWVQILEKAFVTYSMKENNNTINSTVEKAKESAFDMAIGMLSPAWLMGRKISQLTSSQPKVTDPHEHFKYGGFQHNGIEVLTGHSADTDILQFTWESTLISKVQSALRSNRVITASSVMAGDKNHNISDDHVYSVLGYDPAKRTLTIRNPYGNGSDATNTKHTDSVDDGIFELTVDEFFDYFSLIAYEQ